MRLRFVLAAVLLAGCAAADARPPQRTTTTTSTTVATTTTSTTVATTTTTTTGPTTTTTAMPTMHMVCPGETDVSPLGAIPPAKPMLCDQLGPAVDTHTETANGWLDDFNHGVSMAELPPAYVAGHSGPQGVSRHFLHNNHWMVDIRSDSGQYPTLLASWMRPNRTFTPKADGHLVIEFEVAVPIAGTYDADLISDSWPEMVLSTAPAPSTDNPWGSWLRPNGTYLYEGFPQAWTFGTRMQHSRHPISALYRPDTDGVENYAGGPDREWEINQNGGNVTSEYGGDPVVTDPDTGLLLDAAWATCSGTQDPDTTCRNTFRFDLTADHLRIDVKKPGGDYVRYYEAGLIDSNLGQILNAAGGFYVFFGDFAYRIENDAVIRFHWDHLAVNP